MTTVFIIRNQNKHYLSKKDDLWLDGSEPQYLFKTPHQDIALNTLIEINSKQINIRGEILALGLDKHGLPEVEISDIEAKMPVKEKLLNLDVIRDESTENASV